MCESNLQPSPVGSGAQDFLSADQVGRGGLRSWSERVSRATPASRRRQAVGVMEQRGAEGVQGLRSSSEIGSPGPGGDVHEGREIASAAWMRAFFGMPAVRSRVHPLNSISRV